MALAILPIHTIGNVEFSRFKEKEGERPEEVYLRKNVRSKFKPRDTDQPLRYAISFLMNQYAQERSGYWHKVLNKLFGRDNMKRIATIIRQGIHEDASKGFEIIHGRALIGLEEEWCVCV